MRKKRSYVAKGVESREYDAIIEHLSLLTDRIENAQQRIHIFSMLKSIIVSYCQPDITFSRIGKMLNFAGVNNLEVLDFMDDLKKVKEHIEKKRTSVNE